MDNLQEKMLKAIELNSYDDMGKCGEENISTTNKNIAAKECAKVALNHSITALMSADNAMRKVLEDEAKNVDISNFEAIERWRQTKWHLILQAKITELFNQLNSLDKS